jgi:hypothetical protein
MTEPSFADEVRAFLAEYGQTRSALDAAVYSGFSWRILIKGHSALPATITKVRTWMEDVRAEESGRFREAVERIRAAGGFIIVSPAGKIEVAPDEILRPRLYRMIREGWLVPMGDTLLPEVYSQTYKLSSIAS